MKVIAPGHEYDLLSHDRKNVVGTLQFMQKKAGAVLKRGTTTEQVIEVLIDRLEHLETLVPCKQNLSAIKSLKAALKSLEERSADRAKRGVEGKDVK